MGGRETTVPPVFTPSGEKERQQVRTTCTMIPGDGVGPELMNAVQEVFLAAAVPVDFEMFFLSEVFPHISQPMELIVDSVLKNKVCLKGSLKNPDYSAAGELQTLNTKLRRTLDLYANVVHIKSMPGLNIRHKEEIDIVIIREQTEGEYSALEYMSCPGVVECLKIVTRAKSERIAKFAFDYATMYKRKRLTVVHKANIMKLGDGMFLESVKRMSVLYPKIPVDNIIVDNCTMQIVAKPHIFDVLVMPNLYGNILDNLSAGIVGGAGVVSGASYSNEVVVFEPGAKHTYSEAMGKNIANPTAMLRCAANLLRHINLKEYGNIIRRALHKVITDGKIRTKDLGGTATTDQFTQAIIQNLSYDSKESASS